MQQDLIKLDNAFKRYLVAVQDHKLPETERQIDLRHMRFWYPYYAQVVSAVANGEQPIVEKRTLTAINSQSQVDYQALSNKQILSDLKNAHALILKSLKRIPADTIVPYKSTTKYDARRYIDVLVTHFRMHWDYLE